MRRYALPVITGLVVIFAGAFIFTYFNIYDIFPHADKTLHITGGFVAAWFFSRLWADKLEAFTQLERFIIFVALTVMVGFFWELAEFSTSQPPLVYQQLLRHYFYGGSLIDTLGDLTADVFGGSIFALLRR